MSLNSYLVHDSNTCLSFRSWRTAATAQQPPPPSLAATFPSPSSASSTTNSSSSSSSSWCNNSSRWPRITSSALSSPWTCSARPLAASPCSPPPPSTRSPLQRCSGGCPHQSASMPPFWVASSEGTSTSSIYTVKKGFRYSRTQPGCHLPDSLWAGIMTLYKLFTPRASLLSDIPAGDGNIENLFYGAQPHKYRNGFYLIFS